MNNKTRKEIKRCNDTLKFTVHFDTILSKANINIRNELVVRIEKIQTFSDVKLKDRMIHECCGATFLPNVYFYTQNILKRSKQRTHGNKFNTKKSRLIIVINVEMSSLSGKQDS
uniref:Uncharacterized protein n=1 Tax=Romanomermis culicivorax TaxID=13658 RepID=A0A915IKK6_ROMCU